MLYTITQGDDVVIKVPLREDNAAEPVSLSATVKAALVNLGNDTGYGPVTRSSASPGADWANGIITVGFPRSLTATFPLGPATIEVEVTSAGLEETWHIEQVFVRKKHIS